ncbi:MAG: histidine kinase dimerization/phospho-acceptor domain-containing protein [Myxococcota bacterium]
MRRAPRACREPIAAQDRALARRAGGLRDRDGEIGGLALPDARRSLGARRGGALLRASPPVARAPRADPSGRGRAGGGLRRAEAPSRSGRRAGRRGPGDEPTRRATRRADPDAGREAQRLEAVLAELVEGVLVLDLEGRITLANPGFRELFGVWGPVEGRTVIEVLRLPEVDDLLTSARDAAAALVRDVEVRGRGQADRILLAHAAGFPSKGPRVGVLAVFHDVTQVRRVDRVRRDFIANASHELRTPLAAIQGFAETLASTSPSTRRRRPPISAIQRNARRMTTRSTT